MDQLLTFPLNAVILSNALILSAAAIALVRFERRVRHDRKFWESLNGAALQDVVEPQSNEEAVLSGFLERRLAVMHQQFALPSQRPGIVGRLGHRWPKRDQGWRIRSSLEVGYAPTTQSRPDAGIVGEGDADGLAWAATVSVMDLFPKHSVGVNYARTEAGWLLSPQYASNEELVEVRYMWRPTNRMTVDIRGRWRDELREPLLPEVSIVNRVSSLHRPARRDLRVHAVPTACRFPRYPASV